MKKLSLKLEDLQVDSFATAETRSGLGTVEAHQITVVTCGGCVYSRDGGAYCTADGTCGGNTIGVSCDTTSTMNPMASECVTATLAGPTCDGTDTCYSCP